MSTHRTVHWDPTRVAPSKDEIRLVCEDLIGSTGRVYWTDTNQRWLSVEPRGDTSDALGRIRGPRPTLRHGEARWIEVFVDADYLDVITRDQDQLTGAVARRLATIFATQWGGLFHDEEIPETPFEAAQRMAVRWLRGTQYKIQSFLKKRGTP